MAVKQTDLLTLLDYSTEDIQQILHGAAELKRTRATSQTPSLCGKTAVLIFEKPSLRTRVSFETGIYELGGHCINLASEMVRMGSRESVADVARNLERWVHLIVARTYSHGTVQELAEHSTIPVINALTDKFHPCQALAFGLTLQEHCGQGHRQNVVFIGDGNNVCNSIMVLCAKLGHNFTLACPQGFAPDHRLVEQCKGLSQSHGATTSVTHDLQAALANASVLYTDVWASMGQEDEAEVRRKLFRNFQINDKLLAQAPADVLVSHCLPAHRGEEITSEVLDSARSIALDEAENRLHVQKAVIQYLFS
jgi:ornithine carbamoyltransferase